MVVSKKGELKDFFEVYASEDTKVNVLSFADVEDMYKITYIRGEAFVVHMRDRDLVFKRREKLYVADLQETEYRLQYEKMKWCIPKKRSVRLS